MRAVACTVQQALTPDATSVVKQAVSLARRRGNPQVTPLHVASAMLQQGAAGSSGLLRAACLRSHSHPLQCKALELCFNVALNRLPASASPLLGHGNVYYPPSLSNALVAAFKRAQAHQRRGSVDTQTQQPVLAAVKIELEQLVISILDDPSVSRVMREAGFSSTQVKANVEQAVSSVEGNSTSAAAPESPTNPSSATPAEAETKPSKLLLPPLDDQVCDDEDVRAILDCMASRSKRRFMVVAECAAAAEAAARAAVEKIKRGEALRLRGVQVVSLRMSRFRDMPRGDVERLLAELRRAVERVSGVVIFVEDLAWAAEFAAGRGRWWPSTSSCCGYYSAVDHAVAEVRSLACHDGVWLVGHGTYQSYMRCRAGRPSLEILWQLQTLAVPAGSLALSLNCVDDSAMVVNHHSKSAKCDDRSGNRSSCCLSLLEAGSSDQLTAVSTFCGECSATKCEAVKSLPRSVVPSPSSSIPHWLQQCRDQELLPHSKKWSSMCDGGSPSQRRTLNLSTGVSPSSVSSYEKKHYHLHQPYQPWYLADVHDAKHQAWKSNSGGQVHVVDDEDVKLVRAIKVKSHNSSASNGSAEEVQCRSRFKELSAENLKALCSALEKEVPWQADMVPEIASTVLRCRSGMASRRRDADASRLPGSAKEDTWMFFLGGDTEGKARVARELASLVFGSRKHFVSIGAATSSPARSDSTEQQQQANKRPRSSASNECCLDRLHETVRANPHRVIMMEDVEQADRQCQLGIMEAIKSGLVRGHGGDVTAVGDAIVVLSCESFDARSRASSPPVTKKAKLESEEEAKGDHHHKEGLAAATSFPVSSFDLNMSVEDDDVEDSCFTDAGLLKAVDGAFFFRRLDETSD